MPHCTSRAIFLAVLFLAVQLDGQRTADASLSGIGFDNPRGMRSLMGSVHMSDGVPVAGASIMIRSLQSGAQVFSGYTAADGSFEVPLAAGTFEIVVRKGIDEERAIVEPNDAVMSVRMTLPIRKTTSFDGGPSVAIADLKAPAKAQQAFQKANEALAANDTRKARKQLESALHVYPDYAAALTLLAATQSKTDPAAALSLAQRAAQLSPQRAFTRSIHAAILNDAGDSEHALTEADAAILLAPQEWRGHFERCRALASLGKLEAALASAVRADDLSGGQVVSVRVARSRLLAALGHPEEATQRLDHFIQTAPNRASKEKAAAARLTLGSFVQK